MDTVDGSEVQGTETQPVETGDMADVGVTAVRPFLERGRSLSLPPDSTEGGKAATGVRAYAMTRGRAHAVVHLEFETMLQATPLGLDAHHSLRFERGEILALCGDEPLSVAELSARLHLPIGVVRVVAADMLNEGLLESFQPSTNVADDVLLLTRLIAGVRAL
jgi:hypothetical protein